MAMGRDGYTVRLLSLVCGLFLLLISAFAAPEISGKWTGTIAVKDEATGVVFTTPVSIQLNQQATAISGNIGRESDPGPVPIQNAKLTGNVIYFEAASEETSGLCKFTLTINGDSMEGDMTGAVENEDISGKVKVTRAH